jgi:Prohead core protein serine protease
MKLIKEIYETVNYEYLEESNGKKSLHIEGPFLVAEKKNKNGRLYEYNTMKKEVHRYTEDYINKKRAFGELGHPETPSINLDRVSHIITSLREDGTQWIGKAKILETPMGNIAKNLIEGGAQLGVSSRGMGSLKNVNGVNVVQPDFYLATAADIVADPSAPGAFVQGIMEGKEWMLVDGVWTEVQYSQAVQEVRKASSRDIEAVSLRIFENFLKRL